MSRLIAGVQSLASKVTDAAERMHDAAGKVTAGLENSVAKVTVRTEEEAHAPIRSDRRCLDGDAGLDSSPLMVAGNGNGMQIGDANALVQSINEALKVEIKALESETTYHEGHPSTNAPAADVLFDAGAFRSLLPLLVPRFPCSSGGSASLRLRFAGVLREVERMAREQEEAYSLEEGRMARREEQLEKQLQIAEQNKNVVTVMM